MSKLTYRRYEVLVRHLGFIEVVAISREAALADIREAYYKPEIITIIEREIV
jgi:hypothetical protein